MNEREQARKWLIICSADEVGNYRHEGLTHIISIRNPGTIGSHPTWFTGGQLELYFGDVISQADAEQCRTIVPTKNDIDCALSFARGAWQGNPPCILIHCDYGASRSPALAYVLIADLLGIGRESEAFNLMLELRPNAVPNSLIVYLGDAILKRHGALFQPLRDFNIRLNAELFS